MSDASTVGPGTAPRQGLYRTAPADDLVEAARVMDVAAGRLSEDLSRAADLASECFASGGKVLTAGNGGSAADAQHLAAELVGRFRDDRPPLAAVALTTDSSAMTAIANDYSFSDVFSRQVAAIGEPVDLLIGFTTSGRSENVLSGFRKAREMGLSTIAFTGGDGLRGRKHPEVDVVLRAPSRTTARIQEVHLVLYHALCRAIDRRVAGLKYAADPAYESRGISDLDAMGRLRKAWRDLGLTVVSTNGCFDLLHPGHISFLRRAKALGDVLVVGLNSDDSVRALKGEGRPVVALADRLEMLAALEFVDHVVPFSERTPEMLLSKLAPSIHCKGSDYGSGDALPEVETVERAGGRVVLLDVQTEHSTTSFIERIRAAW